MTGGHFASALRDEGIYGVDVFPFGGEAPGIEPSRPHEIRCAVQRSIDVEQNEPTSRYALAAPGDVPTRAGADKGSEWVPTSDFLSEGTHCFFVVLHSVAPLRVQVQSMCSERHVPTDSNRRANQVDQLDGCRPGGKEFVVVVAIVRNKMQQRKSLLSTDALDVPLGPLLSTPARCAGSPITGSYCGEALDHVHHPCAHLWKVCLLKRNANPRTCAPRQHLT